MHWSDPLKAVLAAAMLAGGIWLAGVTREGPPPTPTAQPKVATAPPGKPAAIPAAQYTSRADCNSLTGLIIPVQGIGPGQLTDTFNDARSENRRHDAIDIMAPLGTPVMAAASGRVEKLFLSDAGGNTAYVRSSDGRLIYYYAHLDRYAPSLKEGAQLSRGAPIGTVGFTGNANPAAPHLHFAIMATSPEKKWWETDEALNPYPVLVGGRSAAATCR